MLTPEFLILASSHFIALLSPGPDFFLLLGNTGRHGVRTGCGTAVGIALANGVYLAASLAGFDLLTSAPLLGGLLRWLGAAYVLYLAWAFLRSGRRRRAADPAVVKDAGPDRFFWGLSTGFLSGALNPKNGLFYLGLFSAAVSPHTPWGVRLFYGAWMFWVVLLWDLLLVYLLRSPLARRTLGARLPEIEIGAGGALALLAFVLVLGS